MLFLKLCINVEVSCLFLPLRIYHNVSFIIFLKSSGKLDLTTSNPFTSNLSVDLPSLKITHWAYLFLAIHKPDFAIYSCLIWNRCAVVLWNTFAYWSYIVLTVVCISDAIALVCSIINVSSLMSHPGNLCSINGKLLQKVESVSV